VINVTVSKSGELDSNGIGKSHTLKSQNTDVAIKLRMTFLD
jgi:hypothetical protein